MSTPYIHVRPGHPDFLDLDWSEPIDSWQGGRTVELPTGLHRHPVRFVAYADRIYAVKELPVQLAHHEFDALRTLRNKVTIEAVSARQRSVSPVDCNGLP